MSYYYSSVFFVSEKLLSIFSFFSLLNFFIILTGLNGAETVQTFLAFFEKF